MGLMMLLMERGFCSFFFGTFWDMAYQGQQGFFIIFFIYSRGIKKGWASFPLWDHIVSLFFFLVFPHGKAFLWKGIFGFLYIDLVYGIYGMRSLGGLSYLYRSAARVVAEMEKLVGPFLFDLFCSGGEFLVSYPWGCVIYLVSGTLEAKRRLSRGHAGLYVAGRPPLHCSSERVVWKRRCTVVRRKDEGSSRALLLQSGTRLSRRLRESSVCLRD
jgi:hypothetical protein